MLKHLFAAVALVALFVFSGPVEALTTSTATGACPAGQWVNVVGSQVIQIACAQPTISDLAAGGTAGNVVMSNGASAAPSYASLAAVALFSDIFINPATNAVNMISLSPAATGGTSIIGIGGVGSDTNAALGLTSQGNGNIILFAGNTLTTGVLQFGNSNAFAPSTGFAACPAVVPGKAPLGVQPSVTGFIVVQDWLGRPHGIPSC